MDSHTTLCYPAMSLLKNYGISIGPKGTKISLRYDKDYRNILYQVYGKSRIIFFSPSYTKNMYKSDVYVNNTILSNVDFWNQDLNRFPLFKSEPFSFPGVLEGPEVKLC